MSNYTFIVNPAAAKGGTARILGRLTALLERARLDYRIVLTEGRGHATQLARDADSRTVVAVGGDGTINEIANGLLGSGRTLGIIPSGSGNDLIKSINIPVRLEEAVAILTAGRTRFMDVGRVRCPSGSDSGRVFVNGIGVGFDAAVAARTQEIALLRGLPLYLAAVFQTLGRYKAPTFDVRIDDSRSVSQNLLIAVGNGRCAGGGFYLTPDAEVDDGLLDVCIVRDLPVARILRLMPKVLKGAHRGNPNVSFSRGRRVIIAAGEPFYVHADGEIVGRDVTTVEIELAEDRLPVIAGRNG